MDREQTAGTVLDAGCAGAIAFSSFRAERSEVEAATQPPQAARPGFQSRGTASTFCNGMSRLRST